MISTRLIALLALAASLPFSESKSSSGGWQISITSPAVGTTWYGGSDQTVTWDVKQSPPGNPKTKGDIYLVYNDVTDFYHHLATGFNITAGQVNVAVPSDVVGTYQIAVVGNHHTLDRSPNFTILESDDEA